ncbi:MAG: tetratricopeptide repeat protein [Egibacteraceae bacterium]
MTLQTLRVLKLLLERPSEQQYGFKISKQAGLAAGSLYPILARLERIGWLCSMWEESEPHRRGRPRRRYYQLTDVGLERVRQAIRDAGEAIVPSWGFPYGSPHIASTDELGTDERERIQKLTQGEGTGAITPGDGVPPRQATSRSGDLEIRILGPLEVIVDGRPLPLGGPQQRAALAVLLLEANRLVSTGQIIRAVWGDPAPERVIATLHTLVYHLRRVLEPGRPRGAPAQILASKGAGYVLRIEPNQMDEHRFTRLLQEGHRALANDDPTAAASSFNDALELWRGPALADVADWSFALPHINRLEGLRLAAVEGKIRAELTLGHHAQVVGPLQALVADHPTHESLRLHLALALYRCGRHEEAVRLCREGIELLREQGLDSPALQGRLQTILRHAVELQWTPPTSSINPPESPVMSRTVFQLPPDIGDFTGREKLVTMILALFEGERAEQSTRVAISAIAGKAGVGKTALAIHIAHQLRSRFPDGALYVNLRGTEAQALSPSTVIDNFLLALGVPRGQIPDGLEERVALYRAELANRRMFVVLNNAAGEAQVRPLLPGSAGCAALVTSRKRLSGLDAVHSVIDVLEPYEAVEFLAKVAGPERVVAEPEAAQAIVGLCGYLPLAVRIAGAKLAARPSRRLAKLVERLVDERDRLSMLEVGDLEVRAGFALSYQGCAEAEQRAFRLLGLLDVPDFAAWVPGALLGVGNAEAEQLVERLADAQLLETMGDDATGPSRYRFHDLLRVFARERLREEEAASTQRTALKQALRAYLAHGEHAATLLEPGGHRTIDERTVERWTEPEPGAIAAAVGDPVWWFAIERLNLVALITQAYEAGLWELTWLLANAVSAFFDVGSHWDSWRRTHELALDATRLAGNQLAEAATLRKLARLAHRRGQFDAAIRGFNQCLSLFRGIGHRLGEARSLRNLGAVHGEQGRFDDAIACLETSRSMFHELGSPVGQASSLRCLGDAYRGKGHLPKAIACFDECLAMYRRLGHRLGEASALMGLGITYGQQGRFEEAISCFDAGLPMFRQLGYRRLEAHSLRRLGDLYEQQGHYHEAIACFDKSLPILRELSDRLWEARTLVRRGDILDHLSDHDGARMVWREALRIFQAIGAPEAGEVKAQLE